MRDEMERNHLLVDDLMYTNTNHPSGTTTVAETITLLAQQEVVEEGGYGRFEDQDTGDVGDGVQPSSRELIVVPPSPSHKTSIKQRLYRKRTKSTTSRSGDVSSATSSATVSNPPPPKTGPLRTRTKSLNFQITQSLPNLSTSSPMSSPMLFRVGSYQSLDIDSDGSSSAFSDLLSALPSPTNRSEAETTDDAQPNINSIMRRKFSKGSKASPPQILLEYSIYYSSAESTLVISVKRATGIPSKYAPACASFVRVYLHPKTAGGYLQTCTVRKSLEPAYNDQLQFSKISLEEVWVNTLRFKLYVKGQWGGNHVSIGEATRECMTLIREADEVYEVTEALRLKRSKWMLKSLTLPAIQITQPEQPLSKDMPPSALPQSPQSPGDLFVSIQYQHTASRFKVMVRKADNLSRGTRLPGTPPGIAHYVSLNLLRDRQAVVQSETTRSVNGSQPTWNQPFLLHLRRERDITDYSIELVLMRVRFHSSGRVPKGRVLVGAKVEGTGGLHWDEVVRPRLTEVTRWHTLQPL